MRAWFTALIIAVAACTLIVPAVHAGTTQQRLFAKALEINQVVNGITTMTSQVSATTGPVAYSPASGSLDQQGSTAVPVGTTTSIPQLHMMSYGSGVDTQAQLLTQATPFIQGQQAQFATDLAAYLASTGADRAYFTYDQEVLPAGAAHSMRLVWTITVDQSGAATFGNAQILDTNPVIVYLAYTPKAVASGLPSGWTYPNAGLLQYQLRKPDGTPLSSWITVDTGGALDQPQGANVAVDPDAGVKCLIDRTSSGSCPQGYPDAKSLISGNGAMYAILDYVRMVQPVYNAVENPPGSGTYVQTPVMSLSVDSRTFQHAYCALSFANTGRYGYTLQDQTDRYYVPASGSYTQLASYQGTSISPTQSYSYTRTDLSAQQQALISTLMIDPTNPNGAYVTAADVPNLVYLAPITDETCTPPPPPAYAYCWINENPNTVVQAHVRAGQLPYDANYPPYGPTLYHYQVGTPPASGTPTMYAAYNSYINDYGNLIEYPQSGWYNGHWTEYPYDDQAYRTLYNEITGSYAQCP